MTLAELITEVEKNGRVCPRPAVWNQLWNLLPNSQRNGLPWDPPAPLILAAWWETSDVDKKERFHFHLRWAAEYGVLAAVADLISTMKPEDWHTEQ